MKINQKYNGSIIGALFTVVSLLLVVTIIAPTISVMPLFILKKIVGIHLTFLILSVLMASSLVLIVMKARQVDLTNRHIIYIMMIEYFIIHSFGFIIYWWIDLNLRNDGQIALAIYFVYMVSSFGFIILGMLIDAVKLKPVK